MPKVTHLIEYRQDRQRTPAEALEFMKEEIVAGKCTHMLVIYKNDDTAFYVPASEKRDYTLYQELWDVEQWKNFILNGE